MRANVEGLKTLQADPKPSLVFCNDLEYLGSCLHERAAELKSTEIVSVLRCFARLKCVQLKWIEHLAEKIQPNELEHRCRILFLTSLGILQRQHDKNQAPKQSIYDMESLPRFGMLKHTPLYPKQVHTLNETLESMDLSDKGLNAKDVSGIVYVLSQLAPLEVSAAKLAQGLSFAAMQRNNLDTISCSILLYSLSRLNVLDESLIRFLLLRIMDGSPSSKKGAIAMETISTALYSMARLRLHNRSIIVGLLHQAQRVEMLRSFSAWDLSSILYSLAQLRFKGKQDALTQLCHEIMRFRRLSTFSEQGLALVVYATGHLQLKDMTFLHKVIDEVLLPSRMDQITYQGLCMMVHGMSKLSQENFQVLRESYSVLLQLLLDTIRLRMEHLKKLPPQEVISLLFGLMLCREKMTMTERNHLMGAFHESTSGFDRLFLQQLSPNELRIMITTLRKLKYKKDDGWHSILMHVEERVKTKSLPPSFAAHFVPDSAEDLCLTTVETQERLEGLIRKAIDTKELEETTEEDLVRLITSSGHWKDKKSARLSLLFSEICRPRRLQHFSGHHFVLLISFLLLCGIDVPKKEETLQILMKRVPVEDVDASGLVTLLYHVSRRQRLDSSWWKTLLQEMNSRSGFYASLKGSHISMITETLQRLKIVDRSILFPLLQGLTIPQTLSDMSDKSLILLLQSSQRLTEGGSRMNLATFFVKELRSRPSIEKLPPDLLSILLCTLGRNDIDDKVLFERVMSCLDLTPLLSFDILAVVNILDALQRLGQMSHQCVEPFVQHICSTEQTLTLKELHLFLRFIARAKIQSPFVQQFLQRLVRSERMEVMDGPATSGLIFAAATAGVTDSAFSDRLLTKSLAPAILDRCREYHLGNIVYRLHVFHPTAAIEPILNAFVERMEQKLKAGEITWASLGQWIIGFGKLAEKYPHNILFMRILSWMADDDVLNRLSTKDVIGHLIAASQSPHGTAELADKTSAYILRQGLLHSCTKNEISALRRALPAFDNRLHALKNALASRMSVTSDVVRHP